MSTVVLAVFCLGLQLHADSTIQFTATSYTAIENAGAVAITVRRTNDVDTLVTVDYASAGATATPGLDYTEVSGTLQFAAGVTNQSFTVPILNDGLIESVETFVLSLRNPSVGAILGTRTDATVRITDNDQRLKLDAATYTANEDTGSVEIGILRGDDGDFPITVDLTTADGTGIVGVDYVGVTNTIQIAPQEILKSVPIPIPNNGIPESSKTFQVTLSNLTGGGQLSAPTTATVTITDTDQVVRLEFSSYCAGEETDFVRIGILRGESDATGTVDLQTVDVSATTGSDYVGVTNTLMFAAGERLMLIDLPILNDGLKEGVEAFRVTLANPTGAARIGSPVSATVSITDNDAGAQFEWADAWVRETEGTYTVQVLRGNDGSLGAFTVDYTTTNQTAVAGQDYAETRGTLTFAEGEMVQWLTIPLVCPQPTEPDRVFKILLSNPSDGTALGVNSNQTVSILGTLGTAPHTFEDLTVLSDQSVQLTLGGGVHRRFKDYYDLYRIDISSDLVAWDFLTTAERLNASPDPLVFTDSTAANTERRFYRIPAEPVVTPMLPPTGPYAVGVTSRLVNDPTRRNRYRVSTNGSFMVSVWYPAVPGTGNRHARWTDPWVPNRVLWGDYVRYGDRNWSMVCRTRVDATPAGNQAPYPVILHSHGFGDTRGWDVQEKAEEFVSHGYLVVAVDHWDAVYTRMPDGALLQGYYGSQTTTSIAGNQDRQADMRLIRDQLAEWNEHDPQLSGLFDLDRLAAMGFSWGCDTVAEFCRTDPRCRAAVLFDGGSDTTTEVYRRGMYRPLLQICRADNTDAVLYDKAVRDAIRFQLSGTVHNSFGDAYPVTHESDLADAREAFRTIEVYTLWFLNKHLKGSTDPMPALADYPRVINFKQK